MSKYLFMLLLMLAAAGNLAIGCSETSAPYTAGFITCCFVLACHKENNQ